jgi:hypothetical protein
MFSCYVKLLFDNQVREFGAEGIFPCSPQRVDINLAVEVLIDRVIESALNGVIGAGHQLGVDGRSRGSETRVGVLASEELAQV